MASKQDIDTLLEQLYKVAGQSDEARSELLDSLQRLQWRLETPEDFQLRIINLQTQLTGAQIGEDLKLFQILADSASPLAVDEISTKTGVDASLLRRILRYLASVDQVQETSQDTFAANNTTKTLARPEFAGFIWHEFHTVGGMFQAFPTALAEAGYRDVEQVVQAAQKKAFATEVTGFEWMRSQPRRWEAFQQAMSVNPQSRVAWFSVFPLEKELGDFSEVSQPGVPAFVDIGGGFGHQCGALASAFPRLRGRLLLQDLSQTIEIAPRLDGVEFMAHDFFQAQPVKGAKFYYLRNVLHDWPREKAVAILSRVREAMEPGVSQLLVDEIVLPNSGAHWQATAMDMIMMMGVGARERTVDEWVDLLDEAGLRVMGIHTYLPRHQDSIIQAVAK